MIPLPAMEDDDTGQFDPLLGWHRGTSPTHDVLDDTRHILWNAVTASSGWIGIENRVELDQD